MRSVKREKRRKSSIWRPEEDGTLELWCEQEQGQILRVEKFG
jgi:hypothetical protein